MISELLDQANTRADTMVRNAVSFEMKAPFNPSRGISAIGATAGMLDRRHSSQQHGEQYRHYQGWPYSIIRTIGQTIAGQEMHVARVAKDDEKKKARLNLQKMFSGMGVRSRYKRTLPQFLKSRSEDLEILPDHPLLRAVANPNPIMVRWTLMFVTMASLELTGKAYWWFTEDEPGNLQIWPLPSSWIEAKHDDMDLYTEWEIRPPGFGTPIDVPGSHVAYFYYPDPSNPFGATSPLQALAKSVVSDESIQEAQRRAFSNGIHPGLAVVIGREPEIAGVSGQRPVLTKEQRSTIMAAFKQAYRGVAAYDEPVILDGLIEDVHRITQSPREMDFMTSGKETKSRLTQGWGINPIVMGEIEGANRASSISATENFADVVVNPRICLFSEILTGWLAPLYAKKDERLVAYLEEFRPYDPDMEREDEKLLLSNNAMSRNELRTAHGKPPLIDGDNLITANGMIVPIEIDEEAIREAVEARNFDDGNWILPAFTGRSFQTPTLPFLQLGA